MTRPLPNGRPTRVVYALVALWTAWLLSAGALFINQVVFHGSGIGPGPSMGVASLAVQAAVFVFVARGSQAARAFVLLFLVLAILPLQMLGRLVADHSIFSATFTILSFVLKGVAVALLFAPDSSAWFKARSHHAVDLLR